MSENRKNIKNNNKFNDTKKDNVYSNEKIVYKFKKKLNSLYF
jgi:hypothetical protein